MIFATPIGGALSCSTCKVSTRNIIPTDGPWLCETCFLFSKEKLGFCEVCKYFLQMEKIPRKSSHWLCGIHYSIWRKMYAV